MIPLGTAELAIAIARGLIKLGGRMDRLLAEKVAVQSPLVLKLPTVDFSPGPNVVEPRLEKYLAQTSTDEPGPLGKKRRGQLAALLDEPEPDLGEMRRFFALAFPDEAADFAVNPDASYLQFLRDALPGLRASLPSADTDPEEALKNDAYKAAVYAAAFQVEAGTDNRQLGYPARMGLLVADALAEFGAEHAQLFVRDEGLRSVVQSVLEHFAEPDLETFEDWSPLLRHVLNATLNGVLDARAVYAGGNVWIGALLEALAQARAAAGDNGDNYLLGLLQGRGYHLLISQGLAQAATALDQAHAGVFTRIAADLLRTAAPLVATKPKNFGAFFQEHWGDLLQAALKSVDKHGPALLKNVRQDTPLLGEILQAAIHALAETPGARLLTRDTLLNLADATMGAFASHPELWKDGINEEWLGALIESVTRTAANQGIQKTFTPEGLGNIFRDAAAILAEHPDLVVRDPGLFQDVVGGILKQLSVLPAFDAKTLGAAAVGGTLHAIAARPDLIDSDYAQVIASFAGLMATKVTEKTFSALQASEIVDAAAHAVLLNPQLFADIDKGLAGIIVEAVTQVTKDRPAGLIAGATAVGLIRELFTVFARRGATKADADHIDELKDELVQALDAGLARAEKELGNRLTLPALPMVLAGLVAAWARGEIAVLDPDLPAFKEAFARLAEAVPG